MSTPNPANQFAHDLVIDHIAGVKASVCVHEACEVVLMASDRRDPAKSGLLTMTHIRRANLDGPWSMAITPAGGPEVYDFHYRLMADDEKPDFLDKLVAATCQHLDEIAPQVLQAAADRMGIRAKNDRLIALERLDTSRDEARRRKFSLEEFLERHPSALNNPKSPDNLAFSYVELLNSELGPVRVEICDTKIVEISTIGGGFVLPNTQAECKFVASWDGEWDCSSDDPKVLEVIESILDVVKTSRHDKFQEALNVRAHRERNEIGILKSAIGFTSDLIEQHYLDDLLVVQQVYARIDDLAAENQGLVP